MPFHGKYSGDLNSICLFDADENYFSHGGLLL
jgi:hypothetical protein